MGNLRMPTPRRQPRSSQSCRSRLPLPRTTAPPSCPPSGSHPISIASGVLCTSIAIAALPPMPSYLWSGPWQLQPTCHSTPALVMVSADRLATSSLPSPPSSTRRDQLAVTHPLRSFPCFSFLVHSTTTTPPVHNTRSPSVIKHSSRGSPPPALVTDGLSCSATPHRSAASTPKCRDHPVGAASTRLRLPHCTQPPTKAAILSTKCFHRGYKRFFKRTALETSDYLKDDNLLVHCSVGVVRSLMERPKVYSIAVPPSNIGEHFGQLLDSGTTTDVNFEVDGEIFPAHKLVLAARSPVFKAQFFGPMKDHNTRCIKVEDVEAPVFKALLHFVYWDSLPNMEELAGLNVKWASTLMSQHLLAAADRYALERLRSLCEAKLCLDVDISTVATTLALAEQHHRQQLKATCLRFVALPENLRAVMQTDGFAHLKRSCPSLLTELLEYVAKAREHSIIACGHPSEAVGRC